MIPGGMAVLALLSCAPPYNDPAPQLQNRQAGQKSAFTYAHMARPRGLVTDVMMADVENMVDDARVIQSQIDQLTAKLKDLQAKILLHNSRRHEAEPVAETLPVNIIAQSNNRPLLQAPVPQNKIMARKKAVDVETPVTGGNGVINLRIGSHSDKTRLVFDMSGSTRHTYDFDREAGLLTITLPETTWNTDTEKFYRMTQISGYQAKPAATKGTVIAFSVKNTTAVKTGTIGGSSNRPARLIIDLLK